MEKLTFSSVTLPTLRRLVQLQERDVADFWQPLQEGELTDREQLQLSLIQSYLVNEKLHLLNEATLWARAIYPLLLIAEHQDVRVWSQVPLAVQYMQFEVEGIADGAMGHSVAGRLEAPYLVVVETKRGIENQNPLFQLYVQLLAAAKLNWEQDQREPDQRSMQEVFGCYTIADSWTFVRAEVSNFEAEKPRLDVISSPEYSEKSDAATIAKILKSIVSRRSA